MVVENLEIELSARGAAQAAGAIDRLNASLTALRNTVSMSNGMFAALTNIGIGINNMANAIRRISSNDVNRIREIGRAVADVSRLSGLLETMRRANPDAMRDYVGRALGNGNGANPVPVPENNIPVINPNTPAENPAQQIANQPDIPTGNLAEVNAEGEEAVVVFDRLHEGLARVGQAFGRIGRMAEFRLVRLAVNAVISSFQEGLKSAYAFSKSVGGELAKSMDGVSSKMNTMKNQLGSAFGELYQAAAPILNSLISLITKVAYALSYVFSILNGSGTFLVANKTAKAWDDTAEATKRAGSAAKDYKRTVMGFDELNKLNDIPSGGGGGGGGSSSSSNNDYTQVVMEKVAALQAYLGGFALALGAILTFSGHPVIGIGLMALGAVSIWKSFSAAGKFDISFMDTAIGAINGIIDASLLAIGALLVFSGAAIPLGLGMMAIGAIGLATALLPDGGDSIAANIGSALNQVKIAIDGALFVIGAVLAFTGIAIPLGIGMMAVAAVGLYQGYKRTLDGGEGVKSEVATAIGVVHSVVSGAFLALGAVLAFSGVATAIGIGLMAVGAVGLAAEVVENWNGISEKVRTTVTTISGIVSAASLALGVILVFTGVGIPIGIGLILAGVTGIASIVAVNWNYLVEKVQGICDQIEEIFTTIVNKFEKMVNDIAEFFGFEAPFKDLEDFAKEVSSTADSAKQTIVSTFDEISEEINNAFKKSDAYEALNGENGVFAWVALAAEEAGVDAQKAIDDYQLAFPTIDQQLSEESLVAFETLLLTYLGDYKKHIGELDMTMPELNTSQAVSAFNSLLTASGNCSRGVQQNANAIADAFEAMASNSVNFKQIGDSIVGSGYVSRVSTRYITAYANGGFPEDGLFFANHGELVGQFANGQTAVANNEQIIQGISSGVYKAVSQAMNGRGNAVNVYLDGKQISNAVSRSQWNTARATGGA